MKRNLIGELRIMKDLGIKPNFSALEREYGKDRHTIKKYYDNDGIPHRKKRCQTSKWDPFIKEINDLLKNPLVSYKAAYQYLKNTKGIENLPGGYHSLRNYLWSIGYKKRSHTTPHVLYETPPGKQAQFDWKEDIKLHYIDGTEIVFNVLSTTLGYSREHVFIYSPHKTTDDLIHCFIKTLNKYGGVCEEYLTDNMSAIVSIKKDGKSIYPKIHQLFKDIGAKLRLSRVKTPETKGKDENANKFIKWIYAYDYKLKDELELIGLIENTITSESNRQTNTGTNLPPSTLFEKEKEYLKPLPNKVLLDSYLEEHYRQVVPSTQLIYYKGSKYSLSSRYIGEVVDIYPVNDKLYIYLNHQLIATHNISQQKINYHFEDYKEGLTTRLPNKNNNEIELMAKENLERLSILGKD